MFMAFAPSLAKEWFKNLSIEELEAKYEALKKDYCFNSKEEQINYIIQNYLDASHDVNIDSTKIALEELLKEKTGKEYKIEPIKFEITILDIINFISNPNTDPSGNLALSNYFQKLNKIIDEDLTKLGAEDLNEILTDEITEADLDKLSAEETVITIEKLIEIIEMVFLIKLVQDKNSFNEFTKEILETQNVKETYIKYKKIAQSFFSTHSKID